MMEPMERQNSLLGYPTQVKFVCININSGKKLRAAREDEKTIFVYAKGKSRLGWRYSIDYFLNNFEFKEPKSEKEENDEWHKRLRKAIKCLESSGLWPDIKDRFSHMLLMSLEDKRAMNYIYWEHWKKTAKELSKEFEPYFFKYPFAFERDLDGILHLDTNYTWESSDCKLKSMYFGKVENKEIKNRIAEALQKKEKYDTGKIRTNYDVSFSYNPEKSCAWYSEEFRDCGNGHYYLALDYKTALFYEDD